MKKFNRMIEIVLICLGGFITVGLSINSIIKSNNQEQELKDKTDKIIELQEALREKSEIQIKNLEKLNNPIPKEFEISFFSSIKVDSIEFKQLQKAASKNGNHLPVSRNNKKIERLNKLKDAQIIIKIVFRNNEKEMTVGFDQTPIQFVGFNTSLTNNNTFLMGVAQESIHFIGSNLSTNNIVTNYDSPSLVDFKNCDVTFKIELGFPNLYKLGEKYTSLYTISSQNDINFSLEKVILESTKIKIEVSSFKEEGINLFKSQWKN